MKSQKVFKRIMAILVVVAIFASSLQITPVYALAENSVDELLDDAAAAVQGRAEASAEAVIDSASKQRNNKWVTAVFQDHFWWNSFHIAIQNDIKEKYKPKMRKEKID